MANRALLSANATNVGREILCFEVSKVMPVKTPMALMPCHIFFTGSYTIFAFGIEKGCLV